MQVDIDPLFQHVRKLPPEVSLEQVRGYLATPGIPAGSNSWYHTLKLKMMIGLILGAAALLLLPSQHNEIGALEPELTPSVKRVATIDPISPIQVQPLSSTTAPTEPSYLGPEVKETPLMVSVEEEKKETIRNGEHDIDRNENDYWNSNPDLPTYDGGLNPPLCTERKPAVTQEFSFKINATDDEDYIGATVGKGREYDVRISRNKLRYRNDKVKHLKLEFAVPGCGSCNWKKFRTVDLKGFETYEYGWKIDENGNMLEFWDRVDNGEVSRLENLTHCCSEVKVRK